MQAMLLEITYLFVVSSRQRNIYYGRNVLKLKYL